MIDNKLIEECRGGDLNSFGKLVRQTSPFAFSVAFRIIGNEERARDIVQETMVTVWKKLDRIRSDGSYSKWLYRIVVNKCYDELRERKRKPEILTDEQTWALISNRISQEPSADLENREMSAIIEVLTGKLGPRQKTIFILSELEEMSNDEISRITGFSKATIKANLYHARRNISEMIKKYL